MPGVESNDEGALGLRLRMPLTNIESSRVFEVCGRLAATSGGSGGAVFFGCSQCWSSGHHIALSLFLIHVASQVVEKIQSIHAHCTHRTSFTSPLDNAPPLSL